MRNLPSVICVGNSLPQSPRLARSFVFDHGLNRIGDDRCPTKRHPTFKSRCTSWLPHLAKTTAGRSPGPDGCADPSSEKIPPTKKAPLSRGLFRVAGELGFEPRLTVSETVVLPLDDSPIRNAPDSTLRRLALRELRGAAGLVQADLLALDFAGVAGHETGLAQLAFQRLVVLDQTAGDAEANGAGLAGDAAAFDGDRDVELVGHFGQLERLAHDHARGFAAKELVELTAVDGDGAFTRTQEHAGGGGLATAGAVVVLLRSHGYLPVP